MSIPVFDMWINCMSCKCQIAPSHLLIKELCAHRNKERSWFLLGENKEMMNVKFSRKAPCRIMDEGEATLTDVARMRCYNCDDHLGWIIVHVQDKHPIIRAGQYILQIRAHHLVKDNT